MKIFKRKTIIVIVIILLTVFGGISILRTRNQNKAVKFNLKNSKIIKVQRGDLSKYLTLAGKIDANSFVNLQFQTSGFLSWVGVKEGDKVRKGQAIACLDKTQLKKQFEKQMNDYLTNRWNFEDIQDKYKPLKESLLVTTDIQRILDRTQFSLNNAVLDVEISDLAVKYATLISPINGIVTSVNQPNAEVNIIPTSANFTIIDPSSIYFRSEIDEEDVMKVKVGQNAIIALDRFPDQNIESKISYIAFTPIQGETATVYQIKFNLNLPNNDLKYKVGMNGNAKIKLAEKQQALVLPIEAVYEEKGEKFVYLKPTKGKHEKRVIKTGLESDTEIEITEGLKEEEIVIY